MYIAGIHPTIRIGCECMTIVSAFAVPCFRHRPFFYSAASFLHLRSYARTSDSSASPSQFHSKKARDRPSATPVEAELITRLRYKIKEEYIWLDYLITSTETSVLLFQTIRSFYFVQLVRQCRYFVAYFGRLPLTTNDDLSTWALGK